MSDVCTGTGKPYFIPVSEIEDILSRRERLLAIVFNRLVAELRENNFDTDIDVETLPWDEVLAFFCSDWSNRDIKRHAEKLRCHSLLSPFNINEVLDDYVDFVFFDERLRPTNQAALIAIAAKLDADSDFHDAIPAAISAGADLQKHNEKQRRSLNAKNGHRNDPTVEAKEYVNKEWVKLRDFYKGNQSKFVREQRQNWVELGYALVSDKRIKEAWLPPKKNRVACKGVSKNKKK